MTADESRTDVDELMTELRNLPGVRDEDVEESLLGVTAWLPTDQVEDARRIAEDLGFEHPGVDYQTDDGVETHVSFDLPETAGDA